MENLRLDCEIKDRCPAPGVVFTSVRIRNIVRNKIKDREGENVIMRQTRREFLRHTASSLAVTGGIGASASKIGKDELKKEDESAAGYQPLDISSFCNCGPELISVQDNHLRGAQLFRGLPFQLGSDQGNDPCLIGFGSQGYKKPVEIPIQRTARWVIFAHRLLESKINDGEPVGHLIANYRFQLKKKKAVVVPIRERLEIAIVHTSWGQWPILSFPDSNDNMISRREGSWGDLGFRQTEANQATSRTFVLWAWQNPHPESVIETIRIEPQDRPFLIAAITLSSLEEDPFGREPKRPVTIAIKDENLAKQRFNLSVEVDRGVVNYPYPLPAATSQQFIDDSMKGWGQPYNNQNSPAYVEIAALPSATVRVKHNEEEIGSVCWNEVLQKSSVDVGKVHIDLVDRGKNWVHVTIVDNESGKPVPCRVHFRSPEGIPYQPHGHHDHLLSDMNTWHIDNGGDVRLGHVTYAYIDGTCQGWLPRGEVLVDVAKGFEYEPLRTSATIQPGQRELILRLKRMTNMNEERWFSGDTHVHFLSSIGAQLEAQGEDVNVVNLLQSQWGHLFTNTEEFIGRPLSTPDGRTIVYATQENRQHILGHLSLLGLKKPVMPWCTDGPSEAEQGGTLETTLSHWADECHAQGGTVVVPHMPTPNCEIAALIATRRTDAVEMTAHDMYVHNEYYRYLNGGYQIPLVGGTDKMSAEVPVGISRTYVYIPENEEFTYENWCKNLRLGRTFVSSGPILRFRVNGSQIGDTLRLPGNGGSVDVEAEAISIFPIHTLEIVQAGRVVASSEENQGAQRLHLKTTLPIDRHTWLTARVSGPGYTKSLPHFDAWRRGIMAHTSPIYVSVGGDWWMYSPATSQYMLTLIHGGMEYIQRHGRQHPAGTVTHHHGEEDHLGYLERPFREALEQVRARMKKYGK